MRALTARRTAALIGAAVAALAAAPAASPAGNPVTFDYSNSTAITAYAHPTGAVVVGRNFLAPAVVDQVQAGGGEVYQYVDVIDGFWDAVPATADQAALYGGAHTDPAYLMSPRRSNWPGTPMTDMRPGSPWVLHAVAHIARWFPATHAKGLFLDVVGERLWTGAWSDMSPAERAEWTAGNRDFVRRLRAALGPDVILIANNLWPSGNPDLNGVTIEHHSYADRASWEPVLARGDWARPVRNIVIANSEGEARAWAAVPGVTHVSAQLLYGGPAAPVVPFSALPAAAGPGVIGGAATVGDPAPTVPAPRTAAPATPRTAAPATPEPTTPAPGIRRRPTPFFAPQ